MPPIDRMLCRVSKAHAFSFACCVLLATRPITAEEFTVNTMTDSGEGSLREEVANSNLSADAESEITFDLDFIEPGDTFSLSNGVLPAIEQTLVIDGTDPGGLEIVGDGTNLVTIKSDGQLTLKDVAFSNGEILIEENANLTFDVTGDPIEIDGLIGDAPLNTAGTLTKIGEGALVLTGANTFTGVVEIQGGTLEVSTDSIGTTTRIQTNAALLFSQSTSGSYNGRILGSGTLEKDGTGTLTLTGANDYSGGTTITAGTLSGSPGPIQGDIAIASGATLEIVDNSGSTYTDTISGAGRLLKSGSETLILAPTSGANSWSEGQVSSGMLQGDADAISGNVNILSGAVLTIDQAESAMFDGDLRGAGQFVKLGSGNLTLTGNNTDLTNPDLNAILVSAGSLIGNTSSLTTNVLIESGTSLTFDQAGAGTYSDVISGAGDFIKTGSGTLTVSGGDMPRAQTYTGSTTISAGRLNVLIGGLSATSGTTVASGATLGGTGSILGDVVTSGRIAPGTSIGTTLQVDSITFLSGSVLEIEIDPTPAADQLSVTNRADLSNGALEISVAGGTYTNASFTIIAAGSISGNLTFTDDFPLLDITLQIMGGDLVLGVHSNGASIATIATTANQRAVGVALDLETASAGADLSSVIDAFATLRTPEFSAALDSLSGETLTQFATARFELADHFDLSLHSRLRDASDGLDNSLRGRGRRRQSKGLPGVGAASTRTRPTTPQVDLWFEPFAIFGGIDGHQGQSDVDYTLYGGVLGVETHPFPSATNELRNIRVGAAFAYGRSELEFDDRDGSGSANSYLGALYGGWSNDRFRAGLSGRLAYSDMKSRRRIVVDTLIRDAEADFDGLDLGTRVEVAGKWINNEIVVLESYSALDYAHLQRSSIREKGAASINLVIDREKLETLRVTLGTRLVTLIVIDPDTWMLPEFRAEWHHKLLDRDRVIQASFAGATTSNSRFQIRGADLQRNSASVGVGWTVRGRSGFEAALNYDLGIDADRIAHAIGLRIGTHW